MPIEQRIGYAPGYVLSAENAKKLFQELNKNMPSQEFWEDCKKIRSRINADTIATMNALMDAED